MKNKRQEKILELISKKEIQTQDELLKLLSSEGHKVTQATVSRDIKELKLSKVAGKGGKYRYSGGMGVNEPESRFITLCSQNATSVDTAKNMSVIRCLSGTAGAVCAAIDHNNYPNVVGTIAGDDTILIIFKSDTEAAEFSKKAASIIS